MGTRGVFGFRIDQTDKLTYNHFDSYPDSLGVDVVNFVRTSVGPNLDAWREKAKELRLVNTETETPTEADIARARELDTIDLSVSERRTSDWYCLTRKAQGNPVLLLDLGFVADSNNFPLDSLFCEYGYIINLDTNELEFYEGFNKNPDAEGRYAKGDAEDVAEWLKRNPGEKPYLGIALKGSCPLAAIPEDWQAKFYPSEEEEA